MMDEWEQLIESLIQQGYLKTEKVIRAMRMVPRINFVPQEMRAYAAADRPLPIGYGQTVSAPHS